MSVVGISPSDIVLLARYTCRVVFALKEEGGAKSQYQEAIQSLESLGKVLQELHGLSLQNGDSLFGDAVKLQANNSVKLVSNFVKQISKYDKHLGSKAPPGRMKGSIKKAQWEIKAAGDLDRFRKVITPQLEVLRFMITNEVQLRQRQATEDFNVQIKDLSSLAMQSNSHICGINEAITDFRAQNGAATARLESEVTSISTQARDIQRLTAGSNRKISEIPDLVSAGRAQIENAIAKVEDRVLETSLPVLDGVNALQCQLVSARTERKTITDVVDIKLTQILTALMLSSANSTSQFAELRTLMLPKSEKRDKPLSYSEEKSYQLAQPETALESRRGRNLRLLHLSMMAAFTDLLMRLCSNPMTLSMWLGVQIFLAAPISLFGGDHIWFEDALGKGQKVSPDCYQHLEIFEAFLRVHFREKPGQEKVRRKEYQMLLGNSSGLSIDEESWTKMVRPRSRLIMSMIMAANGNRCPKCDITLSASGEQTLRCHQCQQRYGKYIKEQPLEQSEPAEPPQSIPLPSEDVPIEQLDSSPELQPTIVTGSATLGSPPEIENREASYFKHMHLTLPDQAKAADLQLEANTPDPISHEPESKTNATEDFEYDADVELHKGEAALGSDDEEGVRTPETQYDAELPGNGALVNESPQDAVQKGVANESQAQIPKWQRKSPPNNDDASPSIPALEIPLPASFDTSEMSSIKGTSGNQELLDKRYKRRPNPSEFFKVGRVFALLWSELHGDNGMDVSNAGLLTKYGQRAYTGIRRMVVIKKRRDCCWALPLVTYGGQGTSMPGIDASSYAIAYMSNSPPARLASVASETGMTKQPICIDPAGPDQTLHQMTRINFAKTYTVEHNFKVMTIGKVADNSMHLLEAYFAIEVAR